MSAFGGKADIFTALKQRLISDCNMIIPLRTTVSKSFYGAYDPNQSSNGSRFALRSTHRARSVCGVARPDHAHWRWRQRYARGLVAARPPWSHSGLAGHAW